jgi:hypothetical protein
VVGLDKGWQGIVPFELGWVNRKETGSMRSGKGCQRLWVLWLFGAVVLGAPRVRGNESLYDVTVGPPRHMRGAPETLTSHDYSAGGDACPVYPSRGREGWPTGTSRRARVD